MIFIVKDKTLVTYKLYQSMKNKESTLFYAWKTSLQSALAFPLCHDLGQESPTSRI